jgi:proteasome alpha subunit
MLEEPYRWLEAIENRREYVRDQLKTGTPVLAASLPDGILLLGVGNGRSKVFEIFDRHALAALGHPADLERVRQAAIDAAHLEAFARAPEDVSLDRLVSFALSPMLKTSFEQIYSAPFLLEGILAELGATPAQDRLFRLHFDGQYHVASVPFAVATGDAGLEAAATAWVARQAAGKPDRAAVARDLLEAWWCLGKPDLKPDAWPDAAERQNGWRTAVAGRSVECGWLARGSPRAAAYRNLALSDLGLA